jgi:Protein of unknown function (DUF3631)
MRQPLSFIRGHLQSTYAAEKRAALALAPRESDSTNTQLLADIKAVFDERTGEWADRIFSEMLAEALAGMEGHPWAEFGKARKPITKNQLARMLEGFKVVPALVRIGTKVLRGYHRHQFEEAWQRYLTSQGASEALQRYDPTAAGTSGTFQNITPEADVTDEKREKPPSNGHCNGVTVQKEENTPARVCAQCGASDDGSLVEHDGGVWLHPECVRFWSTDTSLEIPDYLDRRGAPGRQP